MKYYKKYSISIFDLYMRLILIMPITTLLQNKIDSINRILFVAIFLLQILILVGKPINRKYFLLLSAATLVYVIGLLSTVNLKFSNSIVYYFNWIIYTCVLSTYKEKFVRWTMASKRYIEAVVWLWTAAVLVSVFLPSSYYIKEGGGRYFGSYVESIFRLGPTALFVAALSLILIVVHKKRKAILFVILPLYCGFMGSSRTYFVIIALVAFVSLYFFSKNKKQFFLCLIFSMVVGIIAYKMSSLSDKVAHTLDETQYGDFWFRITSSRSAIWIKILDSFKNFSFWEKLFGNGYGFSTNISGHYAHNDFIEILVTHGYVGLLIYILTVFWLLALFWKKGTPKILLFSSFMIWAFNAMFNMFYYYICAALSFPFILMAIEYYVKEKAKESYEINGDEDFNSKAFT